MNQPTIQFRKRLLAALFCISVLASLAMSGSMISIMITPLLRSMVGSEIVIENIQLIYSVYDVITWLLLVLPWCSYITYYMVKKYLLKSQESHTSQQTSQFSIGRLGILFGVGILLFLAGISTINSIIIPLALEMLNEGIISEIKTEDAPLMYFMIIGILIFLFVLPWGSYITYYLVKKHRLGSR